MELKPLNKNSRIASIDALRGFALLGIIIANIPFAQDSVLAGTSDSVLKFLFYLLIDKKFITIFSILFGFGFYIQMSRTEEKKIDFRKYFVFRMLLLYVIGTIHAFAIWNGDILRAYALGGILLLIIRNWSSKKLMLTAFFFMVILTGIFYIGSTFSDWRIYNYDYELAAELPVTNSFFRYLTINAIMDPWINFLKDMPITLFFTFGNMIIGFVLAKTRFFHLPAKFETITNLLLTLGITFGFASSYLYYKISMDDIELDYSLVWIPFVIIGGMVIQSLSYIIAFLKLYHTKQIGKALQVFVSIGQTALSSYILQSLLYITVFYHCTKLFQLFGKLNLLETWLVAIGFFILQTMISWLWLKKFN